MESVTQSLANNGRSDRLFFIDLCRLLASSIVSAGWDSKSRSDFVDCRSQSGDEEIFWSLALSLSSFNLSLALSLFSLFSSLSLSLSRARSLSLARARSPSQLCRCYKLTQGFIKVVQSSLKRDLQCVKRDLREKTS
jgi:hypothetical protein